MDTSRIERKAPPGLSRALAVIQECPSGAWVSIVLLQVLAFVLLQAWTRSAHAWVNSPQTLWLEVTCELVLSLLRPVDTAVQSLVGLGLIRKPGLNVLIPAIILGALFLLVLATREAKTRQRSGARGVLGVLFLCFLISGFVIPVHDLAARQVSLSVVLRPWWRLGSPPLVTYGVPVPHGRPAVSAPELSQVGFLLESPKPGDEVSSILGHSWSLLFVARTSATNTSGDP